MTKNIIKWFGLLILFDALIGGGISAALRSDGWTISDQGANNSYQLGFFFVIVLTLTMMWMSRIFLGEHFALPFGTVIIINIGTMVVVYLLFRRKEKIKWLEYTN